MPVLTRKSIYRKIARKFRNIFSMLNWISNKLAQLWALRKERTWQVLGGIFLILVVLAGIRIALSSGAGDVQQEAPRTVETATLAELAKNTEPLNAVGTVKARSEAELRAEVSGTVTNVFHSAGDRIAAGRIIASIENSSQQAAVAQARARVSSAQANFEKTTSGTRSEQLGVLAASVESAEASLASARDTAVNTLLDAYGVTGTAITLGTDAFMTNTDRENPSLTFDTTDRILESTIANERARLQQILDRHDTAPSEIPNTNEALIAELARVEGELRQVRTFLDHILTAISNALVNGSTPQSTIDGHESTAQSVRTSVASELSSIATARSGLRSAQASLNSAQEKQKEGVQGARSEDVAAAEASLEEATAGLAAAVASLEKTRIRTPISGLITTLDLSRGDFVSAQQAVGVVANDSALEIVTYVPAQKRTEIEVGATARVGDDLTATVTRIAPGLDITRRQVEVQLGLSGGAGNTLTHGETVSLSIERTTSTPQAGAENTTDAPILPIAAIKFSGTDAAVFTVENGVLLAHPIELGEIVGRHITVRSGIEPDMEIVIDARGLAAGDAVIRAQ